MLCLGMLSIDVLGDFASVTSEPGYLDFSPGALAYEGTVALPTHVEGVAVETRTPAQLLYEDYVDPDSRLLKPAAVQAAQEAFAATHEAHRRAYCIAEMLEDLNEEAALTAHAAQAQAGLACEVLPEKMLEKWADRKDYVAYRFVEDRLSDAHAMAQSLAKARVSIDCFNEPIPEVAVFLHALFDALEVHESLRLDHAGHTNRSDGLWSILSLVRNHKRKHYLETGRPEAVNLLVPAHDRPTYPNQRFFAPDQLATYSGDIAALDPPNSGFWRKPAWAIRQFSMTDYQRLGVSSLRSHHDDDQFASVDDQVAALLDPEMPLRVTYRQDELKGRTPKMTVRLGGQNWKLKYVTDRRAVGRQLNPSKIYQKRWLGAEVNVEPVVNHLAAALGYTIDPTYYQERVHLYFDKDVYKGPPEEHEAQFLAARAAMIDDLTTAFPSANVASAFQAIRMDAEGRRYLEVRSTTLEKKSDALTDLNLGYFIRGGYGKAFKREFRAFGVFLAWIGDPDIKDANVKAKLVPITEADGTEGFRLVYSASDLGGALGTGLPNLFPKDLVLGVERDWQGRQATVHLTYRSIFPAPLLASASWSDARWLARQIGQFTREQIMSTFQYAGYPDVVAEYYSDILLYRRDQLLVSLDLMGDTVIATDGEVIRFEPLSRLQHPRRYHVEGHSHLFRRGQLRDRRHTLFDTTQTSFPRYWGTRYPWKW